MSNRLRRTTTTAAAVLGALALGVGPATATVTTTDDGVDSTTITGDMGGDAITILCTAGSITPNDGTPLPCTAVRTVHINPGTGGDAVSASGLDATDFPALRTVTVNLVDTNGDAYSGSEARDRVNADVGDAVSTGDGDDYVSGAGAASGGPGDDVLVDIHGMAAGNEGDDRIVGTYAGPYDGGDGHDTLELYLGALDLAPASTESFAVDDATVTATSTGTPIVIQATHVEAYELVMPGDAATEKVDSRALDGTMSVVGSREADVVATGGGPDRLDTGAGADVLNPGGGADTVFAGPGADRVDVRDGRADVVDCGSGKDTVIADRHDILIGCEKVMLPAPVTSRISGPRRIEKGTTGRFRFGSDAADATYQCKLDAGPFRSCASPHSIGTRQLTRGTHTLRVRAVQPHGHPDRSPSVKVFRVV